MDFIATNMKDFITLMEKHEKEAFYYGSYIHDPYRYLVMIGSTTTLGYSSQNSQYFGTKTNPESGYLYTVISEVRGIQSILCECCGYPGHKDDSCIIRGPNLLPLSLLINSNTNITVLRDNSNEPPKKWHRNTPAVNLKYPTSTPINPTDKSHSPVVSALIGKPNNYAVDNDDTEVYASEYIPYPDTTPIKS